MTEQRRFPFGSVPVYNPQSLSKTEALAQFHVRQAAYRSLMDLLREERPSHVLIIGTRGMGKTTLLQRVCYGVEDDPELNSRYFVLLFPEEQYNVNRLHSFLLNTVDALADAMERIKDERMLARVEAYADDVGKRTPEEIEEQVPQFLAGFGQQIQKSFLLLVDNAERLFETIENQQQWRLRELLSVRRDLTFFGATAQASDGIYGPERAFFEFFKIHRLTPLTFTEVRDLLLRLSESVEEEEGEKGAAKRRVAEWLDADAARLRTLVQLTGGNPRTTVLLFHLVLDGLAGGAREYLEQLLDQVTPGYKGRVDELPPQAQQVLDAVALRWDPVTAMEVAEETGLETSAVSTQLTRLVRQGILEKADPGDSKKALYQVAERFFNIWYLMRASRRVRAKLRWFVEFLRVFFESGELEQMAWERIERYRGTWRGHPEEIETAFAYVLASGAERRGEAEAALRKAIELDPKDANSWGNLGFFLACQAGRPREAEVAFRNSVQFRPDDSRSIRNLGVLLYCELAEPKEAVGHLGRAHELDLEDPVSAAILAASLRGSGTEHEAPPISIDAARGVGFWSDLLARYRNYPPFGKILLGICDLVEERDNSNRFVRLYRAVALAQLRDFPRASVALEDALIGDPIDLLSIGQRALETFFAAAVKCGRVRDCLEAIDKKDWKDAWRPIYEALRAVDAGSAGYLKRVAVEIRDPALRILRRIAPQLPDLPERTS